MTVKEAVHELEIQISVLESMIQYNKDFEPKSDNSSLETKKKAIDMAIKTLKKEIPKKVIIKAWNPAYCPTCGKELSESEGDGYYRHPTFMERCPNIECAQRLEW